MAISRRRFTPEEDATILAMRGDNKSYGEIGLTLGREKTGVAYRHKILLRAGKNINNVDLTPPEEK